MKKCIKNRYIKIDWVVMGVNSGWDSFLLKYGGEIFLDKVNVYLPSLMMKVPKHLYVLGDTYTCHT
jgi:hypothetical protein